MFYSVRLLYPSDYDLLWIYNNIEGSFTKLVKQILLCWGDNQVFTENFFTYKENTISPKEKVKFNIYFNETNSDLDKKVVDKLNRLQPNTKSAFIKYLIRKSISYSSLEPIFFREFEDVPIKNPIEKSIEKPVKKTAITPKPQHVQKKKETEGMQKPWKTTTTPLVPKIKLKEEPNSTKITMDKTPKKENKTKENEPEKTQNIFSFVENLV